MKEQLKKAEERMNRRLDHLCTEYAEIRAGRANPAVLDKVKVDYQIEKAIQKSDIGINPMNDGKLIRLQFPPLTEDRRKEIVKDVQKLAEETKVQIRNVRRDTIEKLKAMKKSGDLTEDDLKLAEKKTQELTDKFTKKVDGVSADKQKEIMEL